MRATKARMAPAIINSAAAVHSLGMRGGGRGTDGRVTALVLRARGMAPGGGAGAPAGRSGRGGRPHGPVGTGASLGAGLSR
jgi:hypothetical protein